MISEIGQVGTLMTRGVLLDIAALKGVEMLGDTYEITVADLEAAMQRQGVRMDEMAAKKIYEFAFVMQPLKASFSGSTVAPVAIR